MEWLAATDPGPMLEFLRESCRLTSRKWRLFGVACCHRINHLLTDDRSHRALAIAERFADGEATAGELDEAFEAAFDVGAASAEQAEGNSTEFETARRDPVLSAAWAASEVAHPDESADGVALASADAAIPSVERNAQTALLRCLFGNPFRPMTVLSSWRTSDALVVATGIYAYKSFDRTPILADALEDAGCADAELLGHLRGPGPHVRGCWALDLLLSRE
jgi:hypothetical protein